MTPNQRLRTIRDQIRRDYRISTPDANRKIAELVNRSVATVDRWLSVKPSGDSYHMPPELLAMLILKLSGKM